MAVELVKDTSFNTRKRTSHRNVGTPPTGHVDGIPYDAVESYPVIGSFRAYIGFDRDQRIGFWRYYDTNVGAERQILQEYLEDIGYDQDHMSYTFGEIDRCQEYQLTSLRDMDYVMFHVREGD